MPTSVLSSLRTPCVRAADAIQHSPIPVLRYLSIQESASELVIMGRLPSYYYKQLAQETVLPFLNGRTLVNQVVVVEKG
jgi:hypothetical protein